MSQSISQRPKKPRWECKYNPLQIIPAAEGWKAVFIDYNPESEVPVLIPFPIICWCLVEEEAKRVWEGRVEIRRRRKKIVTGMMFYESAIMPVDELNDYELYDDFMGFVGYLPPGGKLEDLQEEAISVREVYLLWEKRHFKDNEAVSATPGNQANNLKEVSHARSN